MIMNMNPLVEWEKFRVGVGAENGDRQLTTTNRNWEQRLGNRKRTTSGTLKIGTTYTLQNWISADDFSNVGAINLDGHVFQATGTTPTTWTNSSVVEEHGTERFRLIPPNWVNLYLAFMGSHASEPNDGTASVYIYMYKKHGPAQYVGDYNLVVGDMDVVRYPYAPYDGVSLKNWVNTITLVAEQWIQTPDIIASGTNEGVAMLRIPTFGFYGILVEVDAVSAGITLDVLVSGSPHALGPA